jgi:hypothetical protein
VNRVHVIGVDQVQREDGLHLIIRLKIEYVEVENKEYYNVPMNVRWKYGSLYLGLALFLVFMIYQVHQVEGFITTP